jgi:hypothetical protein
MDNFSFDYDVECEEETGESFVFLDTQFSSYYLLVDFCRGYTVDWRAK